MWGLFWGDAWDADAHNEISNYATLREAAEAALREITDDPG